MPQWTRGKVRELDIRSILPSSFSHVAGVLQWPFRCWRHVLTCASAQGAENAQSDRVIRFFAGEIWLTLVRHFCGGDSSE